MNNGHLFVSFWNLCLDNLPLGEFTHRCIEPHEARLCIEQARQGGRLLCVSQDDLVALDHKRERENHQTLCKVLHEHFGISLSLKDFFSKNETADDSLYTITPLSCVQVRGSNRLLVVNCSYRLRKKETGGPPVFDIEAMSVEFHIIESNQASSTASDRPAFRFHSLPEEPIISLSDRASSKFGIPIASRPQT